MLLTSNYLWPRALGALCMLVMLAVHAPARAQFKFDSLFSKLDAQKWASHIEKKSDRLAEKIAIKTERSLLRLQKQEEKIYKSQLHTKDSSWAKSQLTEVGSKYTDALNKLRNGSSNGQYMGRLDTISTSLKFLGANGYGDKLTDALRSTKMLTNRFNSTDEIKQFINDRKQQLKSQLEQLGLTNELTKFKERAALYHAQVEEYKNIFNEPDKLENTLIKLVQKVPAWRNFFARNSMLSSLFAVPVPDETSMVLPAGLQTRAMVTQNLVQRFGSTRAVNQALNQNVPTAQNQLQQLKDKLSKYTNGSIGNANANSDVPDYSINQQRAKSFFRRIQLGVSFQSQKAYGVLPVTSDIGLSIGYKISDKQIIGIGISEKIGFGKNWRNLKLSHQGANIRSFIDIKLKGSIWLTGGYELNYRPALSLLDSTAEAHSVDLKYWQRSGIVGISKTVALKSKATKGAKVQLLWDLLSYRQRPQSPAIIWRVVYDWK